MKDGKYEVGDWVKSSRSMMDITAGKAYRVVKAGASGFDVVDDVGDENWSSYCEGHWSLCSPGHAYKVGDKVRIVRKVEKEDGCDNRWTGEMSALVADGVDYTVSVVTRNGVYLDDKGGFGWPAGSLDLVEEPTHRFKVGDRVSFKEWADDEWTKDGDARLTGTVTSVDKNGVPNECARDDGGGWGDGGRLWGVGLGHDLQMIADSSPNPITTSAPTARPTELRLTISLDTSAFADKLQRIVDAIRDAA